MSGVAGGMGKRQLGALTSPRVRAVRLATFHNCRLSGWNKSKRIRAGFLGQSHQQQ